MTQDEATALVLEHYPSAVAVYELPEQEWVVRTGSLVLAGSHTHSGAWLQAAEDLAADTAAERRIERDDARAEAASLAARVQQLGEEIARLRAAHDEASRQRDLLAAALEAIIAEPWLSGGPSACTIASAALYPDAPHQ